MQGEDGFYVDNPDTRKAFWETAPRAEDSYGNPIVLLGAYWFSYDFHRFWQIVTKELERDQCILIARVSDGRIFMRTPQQLYRNRRHWRRRIETKWYIFMDPYIQKVY